MADYVSTTRRERAQAAARKGAGTRGTTSEKVEAKKAAPKKAAAKKAVASREAAQTRSRRSAAAAAAGVRKPSSEQKRAETRFTGMSKGTQRGTLAAGVKGRDRNRDGIPDGPKGQAARSDRIMAQRNPRLAGARAPVNVRERMRPDKR